ncbi:MAG: hypothetical protein R3D68_14350 [Hyphomicrobiaceae bacterium]
MTRLAAIAVYLVLALSGAGRPAVAEPSNPPHCILDWSDAATIVLKEKLIPANGIHALVRQRQDGDLVRIVLCREGARFTYHIHLRRPAGQIVNQVIDARTALQVSDRR